MIARGLVTKIIGMIHTLPLPGSHLYNGANHNMNYIVSQACKEAEIYIAHGIDSIMIENMHDRPYLRGSKIGPETVSAMTRVCLAVRQVVGDSFPLGIQVLTAANMEAIAIASICSLQYIRCECFVFSHIGDEGLIDSCAGELLRYRRSIEAEGVKIYTDVKKKHSSHSLTADLNIDEVAKAAEFFLSDGVVVTGSATGLPTSVQEVDSVCKSVSIPVLVGSGVTRENYHNYKQASALIVGSDFKVGGVWYNRVDQERVKKFMECLKGLKTE